MLRNMLLQRQLDNRGFQLNRQGKVPFALGSEGHEALQAGAAMAFKRGKDILAPYYRDLGLAVGIGLTPLRDLALALRARGRSQRRPSVSQPLLVQSRRPDVVLLDFCGAIPHAVGAAYAMKYRQRDRRAVLAPAATARRAKASGTSP